MERTTEEMKLWLFDLAHGNLTDESILSGFVKHYVLHGLSVEHVVDNIVYRTNYGTSGAITAKTNLLRVLQSLVDRG